MLSRTTHLIYITAILLLVAALLRPSLQATNPPAQGGMSDADRSIKRTPSSASTTSDENDIVQLVMLDAPDAAADGVASLAQRKVTGSDATKAVAPQLLDFTTDRLGSQSKTGSAQQLKPELVDRCLDVAREVDPDFGDKLYKLRKKDEAAFERIIQQRGGRLLAMAQLKQSEPELYRTKVSELSQTVQVNRVAAQLRHAVQSGAGAGQVEVLQNQLRTLLQMQLAMSIKSRGDYLCLLEENIQKVRTDINSEAKHFQETVDGRMQHYTRQPGDENSSAGGVGSGSSSDASSDEEPGH